MEFYSRPKEMEPLFPEDGSGELTHLATQLLEKSNKLSGILNPNTRDAIAEFLRHMNSYYSNLIEGHDTHPLDIQRALRNDYSNDKKNRDLQIEAHAHIGLHEELSLEFKALRSGISNITISPYSIKFIKGIHKKFYDHLPDDFKNVALKGGKMAKVTPGEFRNQEVEVGRHIAPHHDHVEDFMRRFEEFYHTGNEWNKIKRIISIAASHHRLAWIHPFLDGNGRVVRLFSDALFMYEGMDSSGLWSISRGLARSNTEYRESLSNADSIRYNDMDGRGNLSNKYLIAFCKYFLEVAIDQVDFMYQLINIEEMILRIGSFVDLMALRGLMRSEAKHILIDVFAKGKISKSDAMRVTNTSDKTLKLITDALINRNLLSSAKESISVVFYPKYPIEFSPILFPKLYPQEKEVDIMKLIG